MQMWIEGGGFGDEGSWLQYGSGEAMRDGNGRHCACGAGSRWAASRGGRCGCLLRGRILRVDAASETEITYLQVAILIDQQVAWLEVAVQYLGTVYCLEPAQDLPQAPVCGDGQWCKAGLGGATHLVDKVLDVIIGQLLLRVDDVVEIGVEELGHEVHVLPVLDAPAIGHHDVLEAQDILVLEVLQQAHLTQHSLTVDCVPEGVADLLDRYL